MARSSRSSRSNPLWLVVVLAVIGWAYNQFFKGPSRERQTTTPSRERRDSTRPRKTATPKAATAEGGKIFRDTVIRVSDGDTVKLQGQGSVRLIGVDCPEKAQPGGLEAKEFTTRALMDKEVEVELCAKQPTDRYGRGLAMIYVQDRTGRRVLFNAELVKQGYARVYSLRPCTVDEAEWNGYYEDARRARRGLFQTIGDVPDAASYRRGLREKRQTD